ncbi:MAG TPA: lipid-A-disaccharide synthase [Thermoanaerobaculia bacterium]|jgi:lipid-A-disaccharide synthase
MKLAVVAGEASGDLHASEVIRELRLLVPELRTFGIGGDLLAREGMEILHHNREIGLVGFFNVLRQLPLFRRIFRELADRIAAERPDAVLLIDYPGFNLRMARRCRELGIPVVYYISPQVWAWRRGRVKDIARTVDKMIVIFPFEEAFYREHDVDVAYVGNPLIEELAHIRRERPDTPAIRIALLPGSRLAEVDSLLPHMLDAVRTLRATHAVDPFVVQAPTIRREQLERLIGSAGVPIVPHDGGEAVASADVALSSSGTATLECAVLGTPVVVMYRLSPVTHWLALRLVKLPHFSLVNIIAGKEVVPELLQHDVNGARIAREVLRVTEPAEHARITRELAAVKARLGDEGAARRAAAEIIKLLDSMKGRA